MIAISAVAQVDWWAALVLFSGGALGTAARITISGTQHFWGWAGVGRFWVPYPQPRTIAEMLVGGMSALFIDRTGIGDHVPVLGPELYANADVLGRACILFGFTYVGGHAFRAWEFRGARGKKKRL